MSTNRSNKFPIVRTVITVLVVLGCGVLWSVLMRAQSAYQAMATAQMVNVDDPLLYSTGQWFTRADIVGPAMLVLLVAVLALTWIPYFRKAIKS